MTARVNLAPDIYQNLQRDKRLRKIVTSVGILVTAVSIGLVVLGAVILGGINAGIAVTSGSIEKKQGELRGLADLKDAVTVSQHLDSLTTLYGQRVFISRFLVALQEVAPTGISVSELELSDTNELTVTTKAKSYPLATKFTKALEASNVSVGSNAAATQQPYFTSVNLSGVTESGTDGSVSFKLKMQMASEVTANGSN